MSFEIKKFSNDVELAEAAAKEWAALATKSARHLVALSGGRIAKAFYASAVKCGKFSNVDFFWADERCVSPDNTESNFFLANEGLFKPLKIEATRIHRLRGELEPSSAVKAANDEIERITQKNIRGFPILDLVVLGLGEDGHVASLFPNASQEVINCRAPFLSVANSPKPPPERLSLSFGAIAAAKEVWVLAAGAGKETALRESLKPEGKTSLARVLRMRDTTKIFTDIQI